MASRRYAASEPPREPPQPEENEPAMSEGITSEIAHLRQRVKELSDENAKYRNRYKVERDKREKVEQEYQTYKQEAIAQIEELAKDSQELASAFESVFNEDGTIREEYAGELAEQFNGQLTQLQTEKERLAKELQADPDGLRKQVAELTAQLRTRNHEDAWTKQVSGQLHEKADLKTLWGLIDYKPDADEVDEARIAEAVKQAREKVPYLFQAPATNQAGGTSPAGASGGQQANGTQQRPAPQPFTQGLSVSQGQPVTGGSTFTVSKSRDLSNPEFMRQHQAEIAEHGRNGSLQYVD